MPTGASGYKSVGTIFALNAPGSVAALRFYLNDYELDFAVDPTLRLWQINNINADGEITSADQIGDDETFDINGTTTVGWKEVPFATADLLPGLYMVSLTVNTSYSFSPITPSQTWQDATPAFGPAKPGVMNIVAGAKTDDPADARPVSIFSGFGFNDGYFWVDVVFTPNY